MYKALSTLTATGAGLGIVLASTSAKAFVPVVLAAIIGGSVLGGAVIGSAAANANHATTVVTPVAPTVETGPAVTVNATTCHFAHRWINGVRHRVQVCTEQPTASVPEQVVVPQYGYGDAAAVPAYGTGYYAMPGHCEMVSGTRVCFAS